MLQQNESIHYQYDDVMRMYGILQNLNKKYPEEAKATKNSGRIDWTADEFDLTNRLSFRSCKNY